MNLLEQARRALQAYRARPKAPVHAATPCDESDISDQSPLPAPPRDAAGELAEARNWTARALELALGLPAGNVQLAPWPARCPGCRYCCPSAGKTE
jgi:hypothetical protein